jgi:prephenate dehydratase
MHSYPAPAAVLVEAMTAAAAVAPERAVAFQGAPGANSHIAVAEVFPDGLPLPCFSFEEALDRVGDGQAGHAVIPIENSLHGRVADMHFLLPESGLSIVDEHFLQIRHCLVGAGALEEVEEAMSHPQALGQARQWLRAHAIRPVPYADTAGAAAALKEMGLPRRTGALAPRMAAEIYGVPVIAEGVADAAVNVTRFLVLARQPRAREHAGPWITTLMFAVKNAPASLYKALGGFATNGVNLTKLESYQRDGLFQATEFYCDVEGHPSQPALDRAMEELKFHTRWVRLLGAYPSRRGGDEQSA